MFQWVRVILWSSRHHATCNGSLQKTLSLPQGVYHATDKAEQTLHIIRRYYYVVIHDWGLNYVATVSSRSPKVRKLTRTEGSNKQFHQGNEIRDRALKSWSTFIIQLKGTKMIILAIKKKNSNWHKWSRMPKGMSAGIFWQVWLRVDTF